VAPSPKLQLARAIEPSGSLDIDPVKLSMVSVCVSWSAPAFATGGWFGNVELVVDDEVGRDVDDEVLDDVDDEVGRDVDDEVLDDVDDDVGRDVGGGGGDEVLVVGFLEVVEVVVLEVVPVVLVVLAWLVEVLVDDEVVVLLLEDVVVVPDTIVVLVVPVEITTVAVSPLADQVPALSRTQSSTEYVPVAV